MTTKRHEQAEGMKAGLATVNGPGLKLKTHVKAGGLAMNHNETLARVIGERTNESRRVNAWSPRPQELRRS